jgi:hypothetical protein
METINMATGPPMMIPAVPVKNMIRALEPRLAIALRSMLKVIKIKAAGKRYLLAM